MIIIINEHSYRKNRKRDKKKYLGGLIIAVAVAYGKL